MPITHPKYRSSNGSTAELFGHRIPVPIIFAPIGINKLYNVQGELVPARVAGELGLPVRRYVPHFRGD